MNIYILSSGAPIYPYVLTQRCNNVSFSQVLGGEDWGVSAADELPCIFQVSWLSHLAPMSLNSDLKILVAKKTLVQFPSLFLLF